MDVLMLRKYTFHTQVKRMNASLNQNYIETTTKLFRYYKSLAEKTFAQLKSLDDYHWQLHEYTNSIATIINHLQGNMKSRFTDFLTSDGEKEWRHRDQEFELTSFSIAEMMARWDEGWTCVFEVIESVKEEDFLQIVYIRNQGHTVLEALQRQLAHYASHIGQIVHIGKEIKKSQWNSLSIPKGKSKDYNSEKFGKEKRSTFFTDESTQL